MELPRRLRRSALASLAALSMLVAACGSEGGGVAASSPSKSPSPADPPLLEVLARVPVGGEPIGIVGGFGSVWVVNSEFDSGGTPSVARIDPGTAAVEAIIPVGAGPLEAAVAFDAVWVSNSEDD